MSGPKTTTKQLGGVFDKLVDTFDDILTNGEQETTRDGDVVRVKPKAATLNTIRQFLRDQNINASPEHHAGLKEVAGKTFALPFQAPEDDSPSTYQ